MKLLQVTILALILTLGIFSSPTHVWAASEQNQQKEVNLWLVLHLRDYKTDLPISNISITSTISLPFPPWQKNVGPLLTNGTGAVQAFLGKVMIEKYTRGELVGRASNDLRSIADRMGIPNWGSKTQLVQRILDAQNIKDWKSLFIAPTLQELTLSNNYTLIKVLDQYIEDTRYVAEYVPNSTRYSGLQISLAKKFESRYLIEGKLWVLKGKLVRVSDSHPVTGEKKVLFMPPAIKTNVEMKKSEYESYYLFPLNYDVTIFHKVKTSMRYETAKRRYPGEPFSPVKVKAEENTTVINWMAQAAEEYIDRQTYQMDKEVQWLGSSGYVLNQEHQEYQAIKGLLKRVLELYLEREYVSALGGARISAEKLSGLKKWISNLKVLAIVTAVGISLFAYGLASLLSSFVFEEPTENKNRVVCKVLVFALVMVMFSLTHPSLKIAFAFIIGSRNVGLPISLLGCFLFGGSTYLFVQLLSIRRKTTTDLALQLGVRSLKRRQSRTLLTLITIAVMVSSAIVFVNISMNRSTKIKAQWEGTNTRGVLISPNTQLAPLSQYDLNWTRAQEWCKELSYTEGIKPSDRTPDYQISRNGLIVFGDKKRHVDIIGIDPAFMEKYYNLSADIRGSWQEFSEGKVVTILPMTLNVPTNQFVTLAVKEITIKGAQVSTTTRKLGEFRVVGTFDPLTAFIDLRRIDNTPLFEYLSLIEKPQLFGYPPKIDNPPLVEDPSRLVLVPINSIIDPAITIVEVTILTKEGYAPMEVAEELAYTLAATAIANADGSAQRIEWSQELSITGLIPYLPPLVIAGLMMYTTMASVYEERRREFTTLATLGLDPKNTLQLFLVEALLLGLMGTFIGFFGSYFLGIALFYSTSFIGAYGAPVFPLAIASWSMPSILVALLTGVVMVFFGAYVPAVRTQDLSLMGRVRKREMIGELISEGKVTSFSLPIRETVQNGEMLYTYVRETIGKLSRSFIDTHTIRGEPYRDGTFKVSFTVMGSGQSVFVPCEIKVVREGEILIPVIEFPTSFMSYTWIRRMLRDLEQYMIGFSVWKEMQLKMKIVREAPRKRKTIEEVLTEIKTVIDEIKDCNKKLRILESQKAKLSEEVYSEFREKYVSMIEEKSKNLRSMTINLEPYHKEFHAEIGKIEVDVERITTAYNLGEIDEEEYVKTCGPLQRRLDTLRSKVKELEEIFEFLKKPVGII